MPAKTPAKRPTKKANEKGKQQQPKSSGKSRTKPEKKPSVITSEGRLQAMMSETERELELLQPQIEKLEKHLDKLRALKLEKQKLITLRLSLKTILDNYHQAPVEIGDISLTDVFGPSETSYTLPSLLPNTLPRNTSAISSHASLSTALTQSRKPANYPPDEWSNQVFIPEQAFEAADQVLKRKQTVNYEIFRAIVYKGGRASTEEIRQYLIENQVALPGSDKDIASLSLSELASRIHYLVRRGVIKAGSRGYYSSLLGWHQFS